MRFVLALLAMLLLAAPAAAQIPGLPTTAPQEDTGAATNQDVETLIRVLEDDQARAALIERLKGGTGAAEVQPSAEAAPTFNVVTQLASFTAAVTAGFADMQRAATAVIAEIQRGDAGSVDISVWLNLGAKIILVFVAVYGGFLLLRLVVNALENRLDTRTAGKPWYLRIGAALVAGSIDLGAILLATTAGYLTASMLSGISGGVEQTVDLFLAAFLFVELAKLALRVLLQPRHAGLRLLPIADESAAYWSFWSNRMISLIGYTVYFVTPAIADHLSPGVARLVEILVLGTALVLAIIVVLQSRDAVRSSLNAVADRRHQSGVAQLLRPIALYWHTIAILYLVVLYLVWLTNPEEALPFMMAATAQSALAIFIGLAVFAFISRFAGMGVALPGEVRQRLPLLQGRLQAFVPIVMGFVRWAVVIIVVLAMAQAWLIFDVVGWLASDVGAQVVGSAVSASLIIVICVVLYVAVSSWVEYRLASTIGRVPSAREKTLLSLFRNAFTVALVVFGLMLALAQIGVNIAPLLAGAGVVGLAIGFGAQKLVEDIITGIFIQFENIMNEGDVVEAAGKSGVVEKLTIRSVTIRDMTGTVHLIPFSAVAQVSNMVRGFSFYVSEVEVAYDSNVDAVKQAMRDAFAVVMEHAEFSKVILDDLDLQGLIAITSTSMSFRSRIKTLAGQQWGAGRFYSETLLRLFAERGIETPTPRYRYVAARDDTAEGLSLPPPPAQAPA